MAIVDVDGSCLSADSQSKSVGLVWGLAVTLALSLHSSNEPGELSQWLCHDDSTINIILVIIIIIIIIIIMNSKLLEQKTEKHEIQMLTCGGGLRADENWMSAETSQVHDVDEN